MFNIKKKLGLAALLAFATIGSANAIVLDTFNYGASTPGPGNNGDFTIAISPGGATSSYLDALGGVFQAGGTQDTLISNMGVHPLLATADVYYELTAAGTSSADTMNAPGMLSVNNGSGGTLDITYGELSLDLAGDLVIAPAPKPFNLFGDAFYYDIDFLNVGNTASEDLDVSITVESVFGTVTIMQNYISDINSLTRKTLNFSDFDALAVLLPGQSLFDLVNSVKISLNTGEEVDLRIAEFGITKVPEPTTVAIFGLALLGFAFSSKRKVK